MKVNKEEIFGMYAALKDVIERDDKKIWQDWLDRIKHIKNQVETVASVKAETRISPGPANAFPGMNVTWDQNKVKISAKEVSDALKAGTPSIVAGGRGDSLHIGVVLLNPEEVDIVARRVKEVLAKAAV